MDKRDRKRTKTLAGRFNSAPWEDFLCTTHTRQATSLVFSLEVGVGADVCVCACLRLFFICVCNSVHIIRTSASPKNACEWLSGSVCALESALLGAARPRRVAKLLQVGDAVEVNESPRDHQDVEQLVGVELGERQTEREKSKSECRVREKQRVVWKEKEESLRHLPRCHTCRGRTSQGCERRTNRRRWCRASPWAAASPSDPWWWLWWDPRWWQSAVWERRRSDRDLQTLLNTDTERERAWVHNLTQQR